jgi:iron complex outermembrane recepter protein
MYGQFREFLSKSFLASLSSLLALLTFSSALHAQGSDVEEVIVTGFRGSLEQSLNLKRNSAGSVDSIHAEDIANFPDNNLAESLQRISGVAIDRAGGEGRNVTVRGMNSNFTRTLINGMEVTSSSGFTDALNGANSTRTFDFNTFDSDLFRNLVVKKTPDAKTEEGSLGATIELQTARPFDFKEMTLTASVQAGYNENSEETDPRAAVVFTDSYLDGMLGILVGASFSERTIVEEGASSVRWSNVGPFGTVLGSNTPTDPDFIRANAAFRPRLPRYDYYTHNVERTGINLSVQFAPIDSLEIGIDVLTSEHEAEREERFIQGIMNNNGVNAASNLTAFEVDNTNTMLYGSVNNGRIHTESRRDELSTDFEVKTAYVNYDLTESFRIHALIGDSESKFDNPVQTSINLLRNGVDWSWDYRNGRMPVFDFSDASRELSGWSTASFRLRPQGVNNSFDTTKLDFAWNLNDALTLSFGVSDKTFEFEQFESRRTAENNAGVTVVDEDWMEIMDGGNATWATVNFDAYLAALLESNPAAFEVFPLNSNIWGVKEDTSSYFAQLDFETSIGEIPFRGNIGFRNIETEQTSASFGAGSLANEIVTASHKYDEMLPSLNLVWEASQDVLVRFSWATVVSRAGLGQLRPNANVSVSGGARTITAGNPRLEPTKAKVFDLGLEYYFAEESLLSLAVFHKEIETFVQTFGKSVLYNETGLNLDDQVGIDACVAGGQAPSECNTTTALWEFRAPFNAPGGDLFGFEVGYQQPFTFLPGFWSNFGVYTNFTYVDAELDYINQNGAIIDTQTFLGLSKTSHNFTLYYEDDFVMGRVSLAGRSDYLTNVPGRDANNLEGTHATTNVDATLSFNVTESLKISLEALNIGNEADDQWVDQSGDRPSFYHTPGTQYYLGVRFSL